MGCWVVCEGTNIEVSPFMYDSPTASPMMIEKLIPKPAKYSPKNIVHGINKVNTNVMTDERAMKVIRANHEKTVTKRAKGREKKGTHQRTRKERTTKSKKCKKSQKEGPYKE